MLGCRGVHVCVCAQRQGEIESRSKIHVGHYVTVHGKMYQQNNSSGLNPYQGLAELHTEEKQKGSLRKVVN